jgi:hypothetical protein
MPSAASSTACVFAGVFSEAGYQIRYADAGMDDVSRVDPLSPDIVVILRRSDKDRRRI